MNSHVLDRPIWTSLNSVHAKFSVGSKLARRFRDSISPFAAAQDESAQSLSKLAELIPEDGSIFVGQANTIVCPPGTGTSMRASVAQMLFDDCEIRLENNPAIERLSKTDASDMLALASLTNPGPFEEQTHLLGDFFGVKRDGRLIAMAGERLKQPGFTEISGVCTHPGYQRQGLGRELCKTLMARILDRKECPYLHVFTDNTGAIKLYEELGFRIRKEIHVAQLEHFSINLVHIPSW